MIDFLSHPAISHATQPAPSGPAAPARAANPAGTFDAALDAATRAAQRQEEHRREIEAIRDKGFRDWARDTQVEKLKAQLRRKVMAQMGVTEEQLSQLSPAMQQIVEQKIEEEIARILRESDPDGDEKPRAGTAAVGDTADTGRPTGKKCPVIPALIWPGGASVL